MDDKLLFTVIMPDEEALSEVPSFSLKAYQAGRMLSYLSGKYFNDLTGLTLWDIGVSEVYKQTDEFEVMEVQMEDFGTENTYHATVYNYYSGIPLSYYMPTPTSGSTLSDIFNLTLNQLTSYFVE